MNLTDRFVATLRALGKEAFPASTVATARFRLLDWLGVAFAGAAMHREKGNKLIESFPREAAVASLPGFGRKAGVQTAALVNGMSAHVAELDDGERYGMVHPGAPVLSALLAVAEAEALPADDVWRGMIVGYEAAIRLAAAVQPGAKERGLHATGVCGAMGAAMAVASALRFSEAEMKAAAAAAATSASGLLQVIRDASELKPYNAGHAALAGLTAAFVGRAGYQGPDDVLGGKHGFLSVMGGGSELTAFEEREGAYAIERVYIKPYAACRHCHAPIDAVLRLRSAHVINPAEVSRIRVTTHRGAAHRHDHTEIANEASAKMSIPFSVAVALETGRANLNEFSPHKAGDADILALTRKVAVEADEGLTALAPRIRAAVVEITMADGTCLRERVDLPKGEPETPLTETELREKAISLITYAGKTTAEAERIMEVVLTPGPSLTPLFALL